MPSHDNASLSTTPGIAYAVLDTGGNLLSKHSRRPDEQQDTASTAKLWTLYTLLRMEREGHHLPKGFMETHSADIRRMVVESNNVATLRLASAAVGKTVSPEDLEKAGLEIPPPEPFMVPEFTRHMNRYAKAQGLPKTKFVTVNGQPTANHYSTPHDMARMMFILQRDFGDHPVLQRLEGIRNGTSADIYAASAENGRDDAVIFGKTGSGTGQHGVRGERHYVGQTRHGFFALIGAADTEMRVELVCELAASIPTTSQVAGTKPPRAASPTKSPLSKLEAAIARVIQSNQLRILDANKDGRASIEEYDALFASQGGINPLRAALAADGDLTQDDFRGVFQKQLEQRSNKDFDEIARLPEIARRLSDANKDGTLNHADIRAKISKQDIIAMRADDGKITKEELLQRLPPRPTGGRSIS